MINLVALTGAGISKASGIPTFQEMGDLRLKLSREYFENNPEDFYRIQMEMKNKIDAAIPNKAHTTLAKYNIPIVTMNVDGLHKKAGSKNVIEIHGNLEFITCNKCSKTYDFMILKNSIYCKECGSIYEPNVVLYGDSIPLYFNATDLIGSAENLLVVGTSFYTSTANELVDRAKTAGIKVKVINENADKEVEKYLGKFYK